MLSANTVERINSPVEDATGLPNHAYTSREFFELERDQLFAKSWTCIAQGCSIPKPGDVLPVKWMDTPLIALRTSDSEIKVFHNVCSHRGNELVWEPCSDKKVLTCPYHAWSYDLNGKLLGTPHFGGYGKHQLDGFRKEEHGLRQIRSTLWMDLVFVNLDESQPTFKDYVQPLAEHIANLGGGEEYANLAPATDHGVLELNLKANWKLCIENNLESYHLPWVHPDLNSISRLESHYPIDGDELFAGQGSDAYDPDRGNLAEFPSFKRWSAKKAEYPVLFPNAFLGFQRDHLWTMVIQPIAPDHTRDLLQLYYLPPGASGEKHEPTRKSQLDAWIKVFNEDISVVEGMHRGRHSPAFSGGVFSSQMDQLTHGFHKWVANRLSV